jgi:LacI family transcriptional regulator
MSRLNLTVDERSVLSVESTFEGSYRDTAAHLDCGNELAECYFCTNDIIAFGFIRALRERGFSIPDDVSVVGFDNLPQSATMEPGLSTIEVSKRKIGYHAVAVLDDLILAAEPQPSVKILVGADLVLRGSHERVGSKSTAARRSSVRQTA